MHIDGTRILVTGGCGLIGSTTIDLLLREHQPEKIVILDNLARGSLANVEAALKDPRVQLVRGDIRDAEVVRRASEGMDAVIHIASIVAGEDFAAEPARTMNNMGLSGLTREQLAAF
mgnify:CR=1 FL=1